MTTSSSSSFHEEEHTRGSGGGDSVDDPNEVLVSSFVAENISPEEKSNLELELATFVIRHSSHHRPIALVTSGGTAADLEVNSVRCLDNFSTGLRGSISVEEFLRRGYAVIHLWRRGSASPYARVLSQLVGGGANHGLSVEALGKLFAGSSTSEGDESEEDLVQKVLDQETDPWLTEPTTNNNNVLPTATTTNNTSNLNDGQLTLHRQLLHSSRLRKALSERSLALREGRLMTVPFRSIEEYLAKLQLASTAINDSGSLALVYLAAAVSDYYIPREEKSQHKIQSTEGGNQGGITLQLRPVPKTMGLLRRKWAPKSFLISFKLETDITILRRKAEKAVQRYGCHMVIGNILQTRHSKVWILTPPEGEMQYYAQSDTDNKNSDKKLKDDDDSSPPPTPLRDWPFNEVVKGQSSSTAAAAVDSLESSIIDFVVHAHFEFISCHGYFEDRDGMKSSLQRRAELEEKKRRLQRQAFHDQVKQNVWAIAATAIAVILSTAINSALQRRANGGR